MQWQEQIRAMIKLRGNSKAVKGVEVDTGESDPIGRESGFDTNRQDLDLAEIRNVQ
jgi:hypothetical protein